MDEVTYLKKVTPVAAPAFSPAPGVYDTLQTVTISTTTPGAAIRYTTDGSTPTTSDGTPYSGPIAVAASQTIKAIAFSSGSPDSSITAGAYEIRVMTPTFSPGPGLFDEAQSVTILTTTSGAAVRYTTDGSTPTSTVGTVYSVPIAVAATMILKAVAYRAGLQDSEIATASYAIQVAAPTFSPTAGTYFSEQSVTISTTTPGASIRYTNDGSTPTNSVGALYTGPIPVATGQTIKAIGYKTGLADSAGVSAVYAIQVVAPTFSPAAGLYDAPQSVSISTATAGAYIRYTTDGSTPTSSLGTLYAGPIEVTSSQSLKAIACKSGLTDSTTATAAYTITAGTIATPTFSPLAGVYADPQVVAIATTSIGASVRYTRDGSIPTTTTGTLYSGPVSVSTSQTIKAIAYAAGWSDSAVATATYGIGKVVTTLAGTAGSQGASDGTGSAARFYNPYGLVLVAGDLYVADSSNHRIRKIVASTGQVSTLASTAAESMGVAATDGDTLYATGWSNNTVLKIVISTGEVTTIAGTAGSPGSADGTGSAARFSHPFGIATDGTNLFVSDGDNNTIRKIVISSGEVSTLAGSPGPGGSTDGTGSAARFNNPTGLATDGTSLFVTDDTNCTIRRIVISTGAVSTLAGSPGSIGSADGTGSAARFYYPCAITMYGGDLFVGDSWNHTVRRVVIATGEVSTLAGTAGSPGSVDGSGTAARFNGPCGIATDGTTLYVADNLSNIIRELR